MSEMIALEHVSKIFRGDWTFKPKPVLHDVSFSVGRGECFGFVGPNGAGKTTTIKMLFDIIRPSAGRVRLLGRPPSDRETRAQVGFLPERPYFYDHLTGAETLRLYATLSGVPRAQVDARAATLLTKVGLDESARVSLKKYSKGMLQRLGLAQALVGDPALVILDEPMSGLDPIGRRAVRDTILELRERGVTVFFSSHILPDVESICDRVAMIYRGRIHLVGKVKDLIMRAGRDESEVTVRMPEGAPLPARVAAFSRGADGHYHGAVPNRELQDVLRAVLDARGEIVGVQPKRGSLEDEFLRGLGESLSAAPRDVPASPDHPSSAAAPPEAAHPVAKEPAR